MKIAMVCDHPDTTGQAVQVDGLAREFGRLGHQVTLYTRRDTPLVRTAPGLTVEYVTVDPAQDERALLDQVPAFAARLAEQWAADRPDVIHAHGWRSGLAALSGADGLDVPVVQSFHTLGATERRGGKPVNATRIRLEKAIGRSADMMVAMSESECEDLIRLGVPRPRLTIVPGGVDIEKFAQRGPELPRGEAARLVSLSGLDEGQGVDTLIEALARIPGAELVVGGGPERDALDQDENVRRLTKLAAEAGVTDRVTFIGHVTRADVPKLLRSADLTLCLSPYQPFGLVPVESMACGTPVVVSALGGHLDTVIDDVTGMHVTTGRPVELARRLRALLTDRTHLSALAVAGVDRARSRYAWERIATETAKVYEALQPAPELLAAG